ncbi:AzlC family ABC transporter permease [Brucella tritici]|uniref:Branched-chain amino acid ABC transporter permease n=1 Tax=Brucella tritici TaxID=94626 RepID=A0A6L3YC04_9HYPH|nr:AzlC family ABC transporter permease [Brucella tritici]KAB2676071.1 branched-chain amino acid ABC transporter permease [Brucella tritici]
MNQEAIAADSFRAGVRACLPTILGYWSIGFAAGSIGAISGYSPVEIALLAGLLYAGSAQFLFYGLAAAGAAPVAIVFAVLLVNIRYLLMSSALSPHFRGQSTMQKLIGGALLTDETFGVAAQHAKEHGKLPFRWLLGLNLTAYLNWFVANLAGAALAASLPVSMTEGLAFSLTAMFIGLLLLTYFASKNRGNELVAIAAAAGAVVALFGTVDPNLAILIATIAGATVATATTISKVFRGFSWKTPS